MSPPLKTILIGAGYWGKNVLRNLLKFDDINLAIVESDDKKRSEIIANVPKYHNLDELINNQKIDCAVLCTPISSHPLLIEKLLLKDCNVLCQKPAFRTSDELAKITSILKTESGKKLTLMACHTFCYHPAVEDIKNKVVKYELGDIRYYKSTRINLGLFNRDNNCLDDLFVHDASILCYLFPDEVIDYISATGSDNIKRGIIDTANVTIKYKSGFFANIDVSWISAVKNRQIVIVGNKKTVVYDDVKTEGKVCYYDAGVDYDEDLLFSYRKGDMFSPRLSEKEAIENELRHFFDRVRSKNEPKTGINHIGKVTKMLEAANQSVLNNGTPIYKIFVNL